MTLVLHRTGWRIICDNSCLVLSVIFNTAARTDRQGQGQEKREHDGARATFSPPEGLSLGIFVGTTFLLFLIWPNGAPAASKRELMIEVYVHFVYT